MPGLDELVVRITDSWHNAAHGEIDARRIAFLFGAGASAIRVNDIKLFATQLHASKGLRSPPPSTYEQAVELVRALAGERGHREMYVDLLRGKQIPAGLLAFGKVLATDQQLAKVRSVELPSEPSYLTAFAEQVLTTNFDPYIERGLFKAGVSYISVRGTRPSSVAGGQAIVVEHLHGYWKEAGTLHTTSELEKSTQDEQAVVAIQQLLRTHILVVVGYAGDWSDVFMTALRKANGDIEVLWAAYEAAPHAIAALATDYKGQLTVYEGIDSNALFPKLLTTITERAQTPGQSFEPNQLSTDPFSAQRADLATRASSFTLAVSGLAGLQPPEPPTTLRRVGQNDDGEYLWSGSNLDDVISYAGEVRGFVLASETRRRPLRGSITDQPRHRDATNTPWSLVPRVDIDEIWLKTVVTQEHAALEQLPAKSRDEAPHTHRVATGDGILDPYVLRDEQYFSRVDAMHRFAFLWLILDQLPSGAWGRSTLPWMEAVGDALDSFALAPLIETEGGFETTILNSVLLLDSVGQREASKLKIAPEILRYLLTHFDTTVGFGSKTIQRDGALIAGRARHTALACCLMLHPSVLPVVDGSSTLRELFVQGLALLAKQCHAAKTTGRKVDTSSPWMMYFAAFALQSQLTQAKPIWTGHLSDKEFQQIQAQLTCSLPHLAAAATADAADATDATPVPYAGLPRMSVYTLLAVAPFYSRRMDDAVKTRFSNGLQWVINDLEEVWAKRIDQRRPHDPLRAQTIGVRAFATDEETPRPADIGMAALLLQALRQPDVQELLKNTVASPTEATRQTTIETRADQRLAQLRVRLLDDISLNFDRYLVNPELFTYTHAGTLAAVLSGECRLPTEVFARIYRARANPVLRAGRLETHADVSKVLSEDKIHELANEHVVHDSSLLSADTATPAHVSLFSISRLLQDRIRPAMYIEDRLTVDEARTLLESTAAVYQAPGFARKFNHAWGDRPDAQMLGAFLEMVGPGQKSILDVGCGPGAYAKTMAEHGHIVRGIDVSDEMVNLARERCSKLAASGGEALFAKHDITDSNADKLLAHNKDNKRFDAIWCSATLVHFPKKLRLKVLDLLTKLLVDDGVLFVNVMLNNMRLKARDGRFYSYISSKDELLKALKHRGFHIELSSFRELTNNVYSEPLLQTQWMNVYARRTGSGTHRVRSTESFLPLTAAAYEESAQMFRAAHGTPNTNDRHSSDDECRGRDLTAERKAARVVSSRNDPSGLPEREKLIAETLLRLEKLVDQKEDGHRPRKLLDAGCGPGDFSAVAALSGNWDVTGVDISAVWITEALARYRCILAAAEDSPHPFDSGQTRLTGNLRFELHDMGRLPEDWSQENRLFDAIICVTALQHIPHELAKDVLAGFRRVLRQGGILRVDFQLNRDPGFDPDLRYMAGYSKDQALAAIQKAGFEVKEQEDWRLPPGKNSFGRQVAFDFVTLWCCKH